jgi:hypothetical protein
MALITSSTTPSITPSTNPSARRRRLLLAGGPQVKARGAGASAAAFAPAVRHALTRHAGSPATTQGHKVKARGGTRPPAATGDLSRTGHGEGERDLRGWPWGPIVHGQVTVDTRDGGVRTLTLQRGVVSAVADGSVTVVSPDGFTAVWTLGHDTRVLLRGHLGSATDLAVGARVGLTGTGSPDAPTATLVVVVRTQPAASDSPTPTDQPTPNDQPTHSDEPTHGDEPTPTDPPTTTTD